MSEMNEILTELTKVSALVFVISSMLAMGLSLTVRQIVDPLKNLKLVLLALVGSFVAVPLLAWGVSEVFSLDQNLATGMLIVGMAGGAPFLPKLVETAKGDVAFSVGLMVLLMVVTVIYIPVVLPLVLSGVEVSAWDIASSLITMMLLPLGIGLFMKARWPDTANGLQPYMSQASSVAILFMLVGGIILSWSNIVDLIGTGALLAVIVFILGSLAIGLLLGTGSPAGVRSTLGLGTAQRNVSAALVVAVQSFEGDTVTYVIVVALLGLVMLLPIAGEIAKKMPNTTASAAGGSGNQT
jgi:BASS family bile acid:Na+ symporter